MGMSPQQQAMLKMLQGKLKKETPFLIEDHLFDKQHDFVSNPDKRKIAVCSRRAGKTFGCGVDLVWTANNENTEFFEYKKRGAKYPIADCLYLTLEKNTARGIMWRQICETIQEQGIDCHVNQSTMVVTFPAGNKIYVTGAKDRATIEKFRGFFFKKIYIDECQSFGEYFKDLLWKVLEPCLLDVDGELILIGTPSLVLSGLFYDMYNNPEWSSFHWTIYDNPYVFIKRRKPPQGYMPTKEEMAEVAEEILEETCKKRGVTRDDPSIRREFFGEFVEDADALVYKCGENNYFEELPEGHDWEYMLGVDIGFKDADALAVLAFSYTLDETYVVEQELRTKQDVTDLANRIKAMSEKYDFAKIVIDAGALGLKITEEIRNRHGIHLVAADKNRKAEYIELQNDAFRNSKLFVRKGSPAALDYKKCEWDMDKKEIGKLVISRRFHSDIADAVLYIWKECRAYLADMTPPPPKHGSKEYWEAEGRRMEEETIKNMTRGSNDDDIGDFNF